MSKDLLPFESFSGTVLFLSKYFHLIKVFIFSLLAIFSQGKIFCVPGEIFWQVTFLELFGRFQHFKQDMKTAF